MRYIKYILLLSIIFFSCDEINNVSDFSNDFTFICVLKNDQIVQRAYLYKSIGIKDFLSPNSAFIPNAEITLSDGTLSSQLQVSAPEYMYSDDSVFYGNILPNKKYDIQVKVNNEIVTGSTTAPGEFSINLSQNDTIYPYRDTDRYPSFYDRYHSYQFSWTESANSFQYLVFAVLTYRSNDGNEREFYTSTIYTTDTVATIDFPSHTSFNGKEHYNYLIRFIVVSIDKNYYDHLLLSRDRAGLSSQYGVFGSSIIESCVAYVKY